MERAARLAVLILLTVVANITWADEGTIGAFLVNHFGYANCIRLENGSTTVVLCPEAGARVLEYSWKGKNAMYLDPAQKGWRYEPGKPFVEPCGGRCDIGPEMTIPRHPDLWFGKWTAEITGPRSARLTSIKDKATGVQLVRKFVLDGSSSRLTFTQTIRNISDKPVTWCHWSRTFAQGGGICVVPLTSPSRFPKSYLMYGPGPVMNYEPNDPNVRVREGFLEVLGTPKQPKLGMDSYAGWFCYLARNDLLFVKRFPTYPDRVYNEMAGFTVSLWYYKNLMCELEPIGPRTDLAPGKSASFTEQWWLLPHKFPEPGRDVDLKALSETVSKLFAANQSSNESRSSSPNHRPQIPNFEVTAKKKEDRVKIEIGNENAVFGITSPSGIGSVTITPRTGRWPKTVVLRLHLRGLESLRVTAGKTTVAASASCQDQSNRVYLIEAGKEKSLGRGDPLWMDIKCLDANGGPARTIPLEGGFFEVRLPKALFDGLSQPLSVQWIDFYRG